MKDSQDVSKRWKRLLEAAVAASVMVAIVGIGSTPARAADATWNGATSDYNLGTNWNPNIVPDSTATFSNTGVTGVDITASASINRNLFIAGAQAYSITNNFGVTYNINGIGTAGIVNQSSNQQNYNNLGTLIFNNNASINAGAFGVRIFNNDLFIITGSGDGVDDTGVAGANNNVLGNPTSIIFNGNSSAGNGSILNATLQILVDGGDGGNGGAVGNGGAGGTTNVLGGASELTFNNTSNAGSASINNNTVQIIGVGGAGGNGGAVGNGGAGGATNVVGGDSTITFNDTSSAGNAAITNGAGISLASGGDGGNGGTVGSGGAGGATAVVGGTVSVIFNNSSNASSAVIDNIGGSAISEGGAGGVGGTGASGNGGNAIAIGSNVETIFNNGSSAGSATINNIGGNSDATGGDGGAGGTGTGGTGGAALAFGGNATITFNNTSHADNAIITNTGGIGTNNNGATGAAGGGTGGVGGLAAANGGLATTDFNNTSSADTATITNNAGGITNFHNTATAAGATITNNSGGALNFLDSSRAGNGIFANNAQITNSGTVTFADTSSSASSNLINQNSGNVIFQDTSGTGGFSFITNSTSSTTIFKDSSTGSILSSIINNGGGVTRFQNTGGINVNNFIINNNGGSTFIEDATTGSNAASITNNLGGVLDISGSTVGGINLGRVRGAGDVFLGANTLTTGGSNNNFEISGIIQDGGATAGVGGSLVKSGTGALTLSGANTYTGSTTVNAGTLNLTGSVLSNTIVGAGATLRGDGLIGDTTVPSLNTLTNGGTIDAGDGTTGLPLGGSNISLIVAGDFTNNAGSTVVSRVTSNGTPFADSNSIISLQGDIFLNGGEVQANVSSTDPNGFGPNGFGMETRALVAGTLGGTVSGTFDSLDDTNVPTYLDASLDYSLSPDAVILNLRRNSTNFVDGINGLSFNQRSVAGSLDDNAATAGSDFFNLYDSILLSGSAAEQRRLLSTTSGDALTALPFASQQAALRFNDRLRTHLALGNPNNVVRVALRPSARMAYTGNHYQALLAQNDGVTVSPGGSTQQADDAAQRSNIWATIARASDNVNGDGNGPGFDARATEYQVGYDHRAGDNTIVGISIGKSNGNVDLSNRRAQADIDTTSIGIYAQHEAKSLYFNGALSYNRHQIDSKRDIIGGQADADYSARTVALNGEVGKRFGKGKYSVEPNLSLKLNNTRQDDFNEDGGPGALSVGSNSYNTRRVGLGVRVVSRDPNARIRPNLFVGYEREFGDDQVNLNNHISGLNGNFSVRGTELGKNILSAKVGVDARLNERFSLSAEIGASRRKNQDSQYVYGGVKYGF